MNHFHYRDGALHAEEVALSVIADAVGTPVYVYSTATLRRHYEVFAAAFEGLPVTICYALKANGNVAVVRTLADCGAGADIVSEGELRRALAAGVPANRIVFSGVGKATEEMAFALQAGILQFNVESEAELETLSQVAAGMGREAAVAVRVNPDIDAVTHTKISTGRGTDKFGIPMERAAAVYAHAATLPGLRPVGLAVHIGSQLTDLEPFRLAFVAVADLVRSLRADGHAVRRLDLGGGLGIPYRDEEPPPPARYGHMVREIAQSLDCELIVEPGRLLVGNAGVLLSRVLYVKEVRGRRFVIVDAAMNDLMRPIVYDAWHGIRPVRQPPHGAAVEPADVVGPICESGDTFAIDRLLPPLSSGDLLVFDSAGAYGSVMASTYNSRRLVAEVLVHERAHAVIRPRMTYEALLAQDRTPPWLRGSEAERGAA